MSNREVCAPNFGGHTVDGKPWPEPEKPKKKARKNTEPAPVADVEEE